MNNNDGSNFMRGCINGVMMSIVLFALVGLIISLACGLPEIVAWVAR